ncbi:MAG: hypothetical protein IJS14_10220 [Lentisphaeria bacterium]|nr:hypothetical protein [Lentisphaeria bacterium]
MDGLTFLTHTVYRHLQSGAKVLLIHHNPMNLCSLLVPEKEGRFELSQVQKADVDAIIAMRKSGEFEELEPLPENEFLSLLRGLLAHAAPDDRPFIQALIDQPQPK